MYEIEYGCHGAEVACGHERPIVGISVWAMGVTLGRTNTGRTRSLETTCPLQIAHHLLGVLPWPEQVDQYRRRFGGP